MAQEQPEFTAAADPASSGQMSGKEYKRPGYTLYVWLSGDRLECRCGYAPNQQGSMVTCEEIRGYLAQSGVREGIIPEALDDFARKAAAGRTTTMVPIALGTPPEDGVDGHIEFTAQTSVISRSAVDDSRRIDMHEVLTFINVMPGDEIGRIVPPTTGRPGRGVTGQGIPQTPGRPLKLVTGSNIRTGGDGSLLIADAAGRVCQAGGEISVAEEFIVQGDVDFRVGSIDFNGFVDIRGDVLDGFHVTARKGMRINGNVGACDLRSEGDIAFCGMNGGRQGTIVCGGSIIANYIHDTDVECAGDVTIEVELHNSHIRTLGRVVVNRGAIAGGYCVALGGVETRKAGSAASVPTDLLAGIDYRDMEEYERLLADLENNGARMSNARSIAEMDELKKQRTALMERVSALRKKKDRRANPKINIKGVLHDNTLLCVGLGVRERLDERTGPFSVIENSIEGGLRFLEMSSLDVRASAMEQAFIRELAMGRKTS